MLRYSKLNERERTSPSLQQIDFPPASYGVSGTWGWGSGALEKSDPRVDGWMGLTMGAGLLLAPVVLALSSVSIFVGGGFSVLCNGDGFFDDFGVFVDCRRKRRLSIPLVESQYASVGKEWSCLLYQRRPTICLGHGSLVVNCSSGGKQSKTKQTV